MHLLQKYVIGCAKINIPGISVFVYNNSLAFIIKHHDDTHKISYTDKEF